MDRNNSYFIQLRLEDGVEVCRSADGDEAVRVSQLGEDSDLVVVLEVGSNHGHPVASIELGPDETEEQKRPKRYLKIRRTSSKFEQLLESEVYLGLNRNLGQTR